MLTEKELNECLKEDIENMDEDPLVDEIAYYVYGQGGNKNEQKKLSGTSRTYAWYYISVFQRAPDCSDCFVYERDD